MSSAQNSASLLWHTNNRLNGAHWVLSLELGSRERIPWSANCELKRWNFRGWKCRIHDFHGLAPPYFTVWVYAPFSGCSWHPSRQPLLHHPLSSRFALHGLHFTVCAPSIGEGQKTHWARCSKPRSPKLYTPPVLGVCCPFLGWLELTEFSPRNWVMATKLTELSVY